MEPPLLSVIVLTQDEEAKLPELLDSLEGLPCEVFVVDSGSTDRTVEIAKKRGCEVVHHDWPGYGAQRNWAMQNLDLEAPWELHLDADERLTPELRSSIQAVLKADPPEDGFLLAKQGIFLGRPIEHGGVYPSYHLRLFRRGSGRCEDRLYDQHYIVDGEVGQLDGVLEDVIATDLSEWTQRHDRWASEEAREILRSNEQDQIEPRADGDPIQRRRWYRRRYYDAPPFLRAFLYFFWRYIVRLGFLDGREGTIFHVLHGLWYRFLVDAKLHEMKKEADA